MGQGRREREGGRERGGEREREREREKGGAFDLEDPLPTNMTSGKIRVCILDGHQAELASARLPFSVCLRLQELGLPMSAAQWSTRQTNSGFSVSFFWPSAGGATTVNQQKSRPRNRRRRRKRKYYGMPALPNANLYPAANVLPPAQKGPGSAATSFDAHHTSPNPSPVAIGARLPESKGNFLAISFQKGLNCGNISNLEIDW
jgi:hypothetical protein